MRVLITGRDGQVGGQLARRVPPGVTAWAIDKPECDLTEPDQIRKTVRDYSPDVILNPAAFTAVDLAESHRELAFALNETAPRVLTEEARALGALMIHYSTDYVFDGSKREPWVEDDQPGPLNVYGESKLAGERAVAEIGGRYLIFRTSWVYGPEGKNFLLSMLKLGKEKPLLRIVADQFGAPTTSIQLAEATWKVVDKVAGLQAGELPSGVYHLTAAGRTTWCDFARKIFETVSDLSGTKFCAVEEITSSEYPTPARRPLNSVLNNARFLTTFGFRLDPWDQALADVIGLLQLEFSRNAATQDR